MLEGEGKMGRTETNVFPITNLSDLSTDYRLYRIKGLNSDQDEYYQNVQYISRSLSYKLRAPITVLHRDASAYLVAPANIAVPDSPFPIVRAAPVVFEPSSDILKLNYSVRSPENDQISLRFLQFMLQAPLYNRNDLWQPKSGDAFYKKQPAESLDRWDRYEGFSVRAVILPDGGMGLCVDVTNKLISHNPLFSKIDRNRFHLWKGKHCIYHYGHSWYEVRIHSLSDFSLHEYPVTRSGKFISLLDYILAETRKPIPEELANIDSESSVLIYKDNRGENRAAPSALCYPVLGADDKAVGKYHNKTILPPHKRKEAIHNFANHYLRNLSFANYSLNVSSKSIQVPQRMFIVPDLKFGNEITLSLKGTNNAQQVSLDSLGTARLDLLKSREAGAYRKNRLDRQYLILPKSVADSYGQAFTSDLKSSVKNLYPEGEYDPIELTYDDSGPRTLVSQGKAIKEMLEEIHLKAGFAVVMIHEISDRKLREEDHLASMVLRLMRNYDVKASVVHSKVGQESYRLSSKNGNDISYVPIPEKKSMLVGYFRGIVFNKIMLTNGIWPFILAEKLHADITIGVDVKNNSAGLVIVNNNGAEINSLIKESRYKEQLYGTQFENLLIEILEKEFSYRASPYNSLVIHRDGRIYPSEIIQAQRAFEYLKNKGIVLDGATLTILEISKSSPAPLRMFDVFDGRDGNSNDIKNPQIGSYLLIGDNEGYLCSTGRAFRRRGTVRPLHIKRVLGPMSLKDCLEDIYALSALTWSKPEDCSRYPITTKLNDRFLYENTADYDEEIFENIIDQEGENV